MREILFRGKKCYTEEWVFGTLAIYGPTGEEVPVIIPDYASTLYGFFVDPETVGQFTGLLDKNGKRIFEGDILKFHDSQLGIDIDFIGVVVYNGSSFCIKTELKKAKEDSFYRFLWREYEAEVIGNIRDNPELMEGEK